MKLLALSILAAGLLTCFSGCATGDRGYHTASQRAAQGAAYDPTDRGSLNRY